LRTTGRPEDAPPVLRHALGLYEAKGNLVSAKKTRALLKEAVGD
jgi:hypothetical protein